MHLDETVARTLIKLLAETESAYLATSSSAARDARSTLDDEETLSALAQLYQSPQGDRCMRLLARGAIFAFLCDLAIHVDECRGDTPDERLVIGNNRASNGVLPLDNSSLYDALFHEYSQLSSDR